MYPLKFQNIYFEKIWGGQYFKSFRNNLPKGNIGESWDIACHKNGTSIISNGKYKNISLDELIKSKGEELLGKSISKDKFPLLIKLINAKSDLSVQVHPDDEYAKRVENEMGKTEIWYVLDATSDAKLVVGTNDCTKEELKQAMLNGNLEKHMNYIPVKKGEVYFIKSGLIHAIGEGVTIVEIQQNSDTTYRVYDYDRGRELHIDKALDVIDLNIAGKKAEGLTISKEGYEKTYYSICKHFTLQLYDIYTKVTEESDIERFSTFTCVEGEGIISYKNGEENIKVGDSLLIPASLGKYSIIGNLKLLKSCVPDMKKVQQEILSVVRY